MIVVLLMALSLLRGMLGMLGMGGCAERQKLAWSTTMRNLSLPTTPV